MRQVPAVVEAHAEQRIARRKQGKVDRGIGLRAGVGLDVGVGHAVQLLQAIDGQLLGDIDVLAATVVALARITLGILVGQNRTLGLEDARTGVVLGRDQLDVVFLALPLAANRRGKFGVKTVNRHLRIEHGRHSGWAGIEPEL